MSVVDDDGEQQIVLAAGRNTPEPLHQQQQRLEYHFWDLPDVLVFLILSFTAGPTLRAQVVCQEWALLCQAAHNRFFVKEQQQFWTILLQQDYGVIVDAHHHQHHSSRSNNIIRRCSKRLKQQSLFSRVMDAHAFIKDRTEIAYFYVSELCQTEKISKKKLIGILNEYGPNLRLNQRTSTGGTFLVEIVRARNVMEHTICKCVEYLLSHQHYNCNINLATDEHGSSLTALCVAAARGMPKVTKLLLRHGDAIDVNLKSTGRFRLHSNARKSIKCIDATALEFCRAMREAEIANGGSDDEMMALDKVSKMLQKHDEDSRRKT